MRLCALRQLLPRGFTSATLASGELTRGDDSEGMRVPSRAAGCFAHRNKASVLAFDLGIISKGLTPLQREMARLETLMASKGQFSYSLEVRGID